MKQRHPPAKTICLKPQPAQPRQRRGGRKSQPYPQTWKTGPDPVTHVQYQAWHRARAQANFREEGWDLSFEQYQQLWAGVWLQRGRGAGSLCLARRDYELPWTWNNVHVIPRSQHCQRTNRIMKGLI